MSENNNTTHLTAEQAFQAQQDMIHQLQAQVNALQTSTNIRPEHYNNTFTPRTTSTTTFTPTPMEIDATQAHQTYGPLSQAEREHRMKNNLCNYCGKPGHKAFECRAAQRRRQIKTQVNATTTVDTKAKNSQPQA
ncbi:hypothetical protein TREMEDRAFT_64120 [Tremella mesenterica DSM 1558]|uniref:uncharacterized protein n=1 Tax=Tremella mesenterica (strain ATCC 24925 / CBS 8224 / DSM 1558 / NBRC 9311 / NRRL Y-6157 / RJB 2259-6 / UBC 559-6) TaxID=578456 RepID=UPI0003F492D1|nr:uncharacterized protein TREMEDRAFT_64120 [Tremella mesenterica DSM 1558]EIW67533.1 hypothetical protein TREMEDRAFT_64120 [Tremella mesenterica DSM 1558]